MMSQITYKVIVSSLQPNETALLLIEIDEFRKSCYRVTYKQICSSFGHPNQNNEDAKKLRKYKNLSHTYSYSWKHNELQGKIDELIVAAYPGGECKESENKLQMKVLESYIAEVSFEQRCGVEIIKTCRNKFLSSMLVLIYSINIEPDFRIARFLETGAAKDVPQIENEFANESRIWDGICLVLPEKIKNSLEIERWITKTLEEKYGTNFKVDVDIIFPIQPVIIHIDPNKDSTQD